MNLLSNSFQQIQQTIPIYCPAVLSTKVGRTPKVSEVQLCALYILSYITNILLKLLLGEKVRLIVDGTILETAKLSRARTQKIKRFSGKAFWGKKKRKLYSHRYKQ